MYVGFALEDAPPGEPAGTKARVWFRATYAAQKDASPVKLVAVAGKKDVYHLFNMWGDSEYQHYLGTDSNNTGFVSSGGLYDPAGKAMPVLMTRVGNSTSRYTMTDETTSKYVSYCDGGCSNGKWLRADYTSESDAMVVELVPSGATPSSDWGYCVSALSTPEQINIQIASPDTVVVSFVTFEPHPLTTPPLLKYGKTSDLGQQATGVSHVHVTAAGDRTYWMHFVKLSNLNPRTRYFYSVGSNPAKFSPVFSFRSGYSDGPTKIAIYGDMGVYSWNNMANLRSDMLAETSDLIVHMGDHAYNEGDDDERRADGYMSAFQPILAGIPWMPVVGNHEYYSGAVLERFLNQTWGGHSWDTVEHGISTASSALGALLSRGLHHSAGLHGSTPSNTSRYFSADFGLIHLVALDLNMYFGTDDCGDPCKQAQMSWLQQDLAQANSNREAVPWVVAMSHFPFYCTGCQGEMKGETGELLARYYDSFRAEKFGNGNRTAQDAMLQEEMLGGIELGAGANLTVKQAADAVISDLMPIIHSGGVDLYAAGHWHYYESLWPSVVGKTGIGGAVLSKDFLEPNVTVHVTSGNGGPPGPDNFREDCGDPSDCGAIAATRSQSVNFGYGRLVAHNQTHLQFTQVRNNDSVVEDDWTIVQSSHGPRPL
eukprot:TRINITY_DN2430_c0_g1_i1.p1 TRINITY_DN2430_c0_g1~~TRINITY_DN2430_c0_g1_i1.p1  ORF type:complete len:654 (+),score=156.53 TRINITY_DN2430_c0_g1_i1:294-2255(+)